jgi:hypothetical protein
MRLARVENQEWCEDGTKDEGCGIPREEPDRPRRKADPVDRTKRRADDAHYYHDDLRDGRTSTRGRVEPGLPVGHEPVGVIEKLGSAVEGYAEGQRVIAGAITPSGHS